MATMCFAIWLQEQDATRGGNYHLMLLLIALITAAIGLLAIVMVVVALKAARALKDLTEAAHEVKSRLLPLIEVATEVGRTSDALLRDAAPKVKTITDNLMKASDTLAETSQAARAAVGQCEATIADVNRRTQRQVARVDGMVTAALTTTAEVVDTIGNGIRVPAQKIAAMAAQVKQVVDGLLAKLKSAAGRVPFGGRDTPAD